MTPLRKLKEEAAFFWDGWVDTNDPILFCAWWAVCEQILARVNQGAPPLLWTPKERKHG